MVMLRKFKALRPKKGLEKQVASPPYDVLSSEEAREMAQGNPYSFLHVIKPEIDLPPGTDLYAPEVYQKARENMEKFIQEGILIQEDKPRLYIYRQVMQGREQYGIVGCVSAEEYEKDLIKKHELTRKAKEEDRVKHIEATNAHAGPVFLTYKARENIDKLVAQEAAKEPLYDFVADDGVRHTVWGIDDEVAEKIIEEFSKVDCLYVADGHHRSASGTIVAQRRKAANPHHTGEEEYNYFLAVLFPHNQLKIMDYNRVVKDLNGHSSEELFQFLEEIFTVEEIGETPYRPQKKGEVGMYYNGQWYKLTFKPEKIDKDDPVNSLDTALLQNLVLRPFFGIDDPRTSDRIDFVGGIRGLEELKKRVDSGQYKVAFALYPTSIEELMRIADAGQVMPPKSTWFEPKLRSGLLIHRLD
ncbi:MAG: DUF1015 domain-containing protein [Candidatus Aminicenantes bacterium]|nr:DUF1015 domain-containing protein [Candidatus Aminicenantes bacterium]RLE01337.1 MAG: DUF1015 domain-containing protein [Candidatus Aminicenantes bacterium]